MRFELVRVKVNTHIILAIQHQTTIRWRLFVDALSRHAVVPLRCLVWSGMMNDATMLGSYSHESAEAGVEITRCSALLVAAIESSTDVAHRRRQGAYCMLHVYTQPHPGARVDAGLPSGSSLDQTFMAKTHKEASLRSETRTYRTAEAFPSVPISAYPSFRIL
jgi:hypothetical protein